MQNLESINITGNAALESMQYQLGNDSNGTEVLTIVAKYLTITDNSKLFYLDMSYW